jgi:hypothetical protein
VRLGRCETGRRSIDAASSVALRTARMLASMFFVLVSQTHDTFALWDRSQRNNILGLVVAVILAADTVFFLLFVVFLLRRIFESFCFVFFFLFCFFFFFFVFLFFCFFLVNFPLYLISQARINEVKVCWPLLLLVREHARFVFDSLNFDLHSKLPPLQI